MRLTWRRTPRETGLARVTHRAEHRGAGMYLDGYRVACAVWSSVGWYWAIQSDNALGVPWANSADEETYYATLDEAKAACKARFLAAMKANKEANHGVL